MVFALFDLPVRAGPAQMLALTWEEYDTAMLAVLAGALRLATTDLGTAGNPLLASHVQHARYRLSSSVDESFLGVRRAASIEAPAGQSGWSAVSFAVLAGAEAPGFWVDFDTVNYKDTTVEMLAAACFDNGTLYGSQPGNYRTRAVSRIEAENIDAVWKVVSRWFQHMEHGEAALHMPDPFWKDLPGKRPLTQSVADKLAAEVEADFEMERNRFPAGGGPGFSCLSAPERLAFAQEVWRAVKSTARLIEEARAAPLPPEPKEPAPG